MFEINRHRHFLALKPWRHGQVVYFRKTTDSIMMPGQEPQIVKLDAGREFSAAMCPGRLKVDVSVKEPKINGLQYVAVTFFFGLKNWYRETF